LRDTADCLLLCSAAHLVLSFFSVNYSQKEILRMVQCSGVPTPTYWAAVVEIVISILGLIFNFVAIFVIVVLKDFKKSISHWSVGET